MAKRRLTSTMRYRLKRFAEDTVKPVAEAAALKAAYELAAPLVRRVVEQRYNPTEMAVLEKYGFTERDTCIRVQFPNGVVQEFSFDQQLAAPLVPDRRGCSKRIYLADELTAAAIEAWADATNAYDAEKKQRVDAYSALALGSQYVEDVCAIWPEAATVLPADNALIALGPEQIARIKADRHERMAQAESVQ